MIFVIFYQNLKNNFLLKWIRKLLSRWKCGFNIEFDVNNTGYMDVALFASDTPFIYIVFSNQIETYKRVFSRYKRDYDVLKESLGMNQV